MPNYLASCAIHGEMPERLNGPVSKTGVGATLPGVQIPLSPPQFKHLAHLLSTISLTLRIQLEYSVRILREKRIAILCFFCQKRGQ